MMDDVVFHYAVQSGTFVWPWTSESGLLVIRGAAGGGGSGSLLIADLHKSPADAGDGGSGGEATSVSHNATTWCANGGNGGGGGFCKNKGSTTPVAAQDGRGCDHGAGGTTNRSKATPLRQTVNEERERTIFLASNGGSGGKGFPGETRVVELGKLSQGDSFNINIGTGGRGGKGGKGYRSGSNGQQGAGGFVLFVPLRQSSQQQ